MLYYDAKKEEYTASSPDGEVSRKLNRAQGEKYVIDVFGRDKAEEILTRAYEQKRGFWIS